MKLTRRELLRYSSAAAATAAVGDWTHAAEPAGDFQLKYLLGSSLYGYTDVREILPEVKKTGATAIDLWPKVHGSQREQLDELGEEKFAALLKQHDVTLGCITQYKLGPFGLQQELRVAQRLGCHTIVTGGAGPKGLKGAELKQAVNAFVEKLKPHLATAAECGVTIAIENHANNLMESPDALKWLAELRPSEHLGIALAPYHLPQDEAQLSLLIRALGPAITVFYAWQHGQGSHQKQPRAQELEQLPGRGKLDFKPLLQTLREIKFTGWTEIFMHPFPRGVAIMDTTADVTEEINRARQYLTQCLSAR